MIDIEELKKAGQIKTSTLSNDDYHNGIGLSSSNVKKIVKDIDLYHYENENPKPKTDALKFGTMFDDFVFNTTDFFHNKYAVSQKFDRRTKQGKIDSAKFEEDNKDKEIIDEVDLNKASAMSKVLFLNETVSNIISECEKQLSFFTYEVFSERILKARPDIIHKGFIWDLKTCEDIDDYSIKKAINKFGYDISLGMYANVISEFEEVTGAGWIFISKKKPHRVRILAMSESDFIESQNKADNQVQKAETLLKEKFTTYQDGIEVFDWKWRK